MSTSVNAIILITGPIPKPTTKRPAGSCGP